MDGVGCFLLTDLLADAFPFYGVSFLPADLLGVYFRSLSTFFLTSPVASTDFFPAFPAFLEWAFFLPLAPPLTFA